MKFLVGLAAFFGTFLVYDFISCQIFPVDENNAFQAPDAYYALGLLACVLAAYFAVKAYSQRSSTRKKSGGCSNSNWSRLTKEQKYKLAEDAVIESKDASSYFLQRKFHISYREAAELIDELEISGIISPYNGSNPRIVYGSAHFVNNPALDIVDTMSGHDFEHWCADLLLRNKFINVTVTPGSGDHGVDVLAEKDGIHYAIQCKCYTHDLGNTPVQEVYAGKEMYRCQVGVVMTNRYFTTGAKQLAEQTRVLLWDRDKLQSLIESAE